MLPAVPPAWMFEPFLGATPYKLGAQMPIPKIPDIDRFAPMNSVNIWDCWYKLSMNFSEARSGPVDG